MDKLSHSSSTDLDRPEVLAVARGSSLYWAYTQPSLPSGSVLRLWPALL